MVELSKSLFLKSRKKIYNHLKIVISILIFYNIGLFITYDLIIDFLLNDRTIKNLKLLIIIFSVSASFSALIPILNNFFIVYDKNDYSLKSSFIVFIINIIISPLMLIKFNFLGAFIGLSIVQFLLFVINLYYFNYLTRFK